MKIALLGYGKMGKAIEKIALDRGHEILLKIGSSNMEDLNENKLKDIDVAIDFSIPEKAFNLISKTLMVGVPVVSGTTAWLHDLSKAENLAKENKAGFIYASNFSLGVNLFFEMNQRLAEIMNPHSNFDVSMTEIHHIHKVDAPSGTAITLAEGILKTHLNKNEWSIDNDAEKLHIEVERTGEIPGTHIVEYKSEYDEIRFEHEAINRNGFALGAVVAAEWIVGKSGVFTMKDVLFSR